ncbi:substrate-binding domain-containing protein [Lutibacter sp. A64]|uniref:substrate-binding domain-containing protein n=1 Tax=Lutibacter sp. A64 TaxID=2918526 RepID=UPI001F06D5CA|nr:substrate-binding domain-containing protein [Lutibacter sp. A64]UMB55177.1 substrate-binding domain-containing protein [Lutibacter sp. A64]
MITIKEIAKIANVSVGTVDRVIHDRDGVSNKTREKVQKILTEKNFKINNIARSLAMKKKYNLSVLMPSFDSNNLFWKSPLLGISKAAEEVLSFGVEVNKYTFDQLDNKSYFKSFKKLIEVNPEAVILTPLFFNETKKMVNILDEKKIPYIFLNIEMNGFNNISFIGQNSYKSGYLSGKLMHLCTEHEANYLITDIESKLYNNNVIEGRVQGFKAYFNSNKIPFKTTSLKFEDLKNLDYVKQQLKNVFENHSNISGILVPSSRISTISSCINSEKLRTLSLIGFDTTDQNIEYLKNDKITFLISQKSFNQGFKSVKIMADYLIQNTIPQEKIYSPLEIITKENLEFSQQEKWLYIHKKER